MKYLYLCFLGWILLEGCTTCKEEHACSLSPNYLFPQFYGFSYEEIDTIIVRRFIANTNFQIQKDSLLVDTIGYAYGSYGGRLSIIKSKDESSPDSFYRVGIDLLDFTAQSYPLDDIEIVVPAAERSFRIYGFSSEHKTITVEYSCGRTPQGGSCISKVFYYYVDGKLVTLYKKDASGNDVLVAESERRLKLVK